MGGMQLGMDLIPVPGQSVLIQVQGELGTDTLIHATRLMQPIRVD